MSRLSRVAGLIACAWLVSLTFAVAADSQGRGGARRPPPPPPHQPQASVVLSGHVFIGGYFYDPFFGPYPWWPRTAYPYWYFPVYGQRWISSDEGHFVVQVPVCMHRIDVTKSGYQRFATDIEVVDGETTPLTVSVMSAARP